jgi:2-methylcitrate dehydratase PrpD
MESGISRTPNYKDNEFMEADMHPFRALLDLTWDKAPIGVRRGIKLRVLDVLGAIFAAVDTKEGKITSRFVKSFFAGEDASILVSGAPKCSLLGAAIANATLASALDIDDGYRLACGHPGSVIIPAAMAVGEWQKVSGQRFLESIIVGYEVATRTGQATYLDAKDRFFGSGAWASSGAAAAAGFLLSLSEQSFIEALGITEAYTPLAPNLKSIANGSMVKESIGWGAATGIAGSLLARDGFTGVVPILLNPGYHYLAEDLGCCFRVPDTYFKLYAVCRWAHPAVEGVRELRDRFKIKPESVDKIRVETFPKALTIGNPAPTTPVAAQYSLPFAVAAFLQDGVIGPKQVTDTAILREELLAMAKRVELVVDAEIKARFPEECLARVTITTKDGENYRSGIMGSRGDPERPLSVDEIKGKFRRLTKGTLSDRAVCDIWEAVEGLEEYPFEDFVDLVRRCLTS